MPKLSEEKFIFEIYYECNYAQFGADVKWKFTVIALLMRKIK